MKKAGILLIFMVYAVIVTAFGVSRYHNYRKSFDKIVPYSHSMEIQPTETTLETETIQESQIYLETVAFDFTALPTETIAILSPAPIPTNPPVSTTATESIEPVQEEIPQPAPQNELIVEYPLNLNTATFEELCTLPEIGEVLAGAIIDYRNQIGGFINREQLLEVSGIGQHRYSVIAPFLMIENEQPLPVEEPAPEPQAIQSPEPEPLPTEPPEIPYINLNTTTKEQLMLLPNCTEEIAEKILVLRDVHIHTFSNPLEILYVNDILVKGIPKDVEISRELYYSWEEYLFVDDSGGKQLHLYTRPEPE